MQIRIEENARTILSGFGKFFKTLEIGIVRISDFLFNLFNILPLPDPDSRRQNIVNPDLNLYILSRV